MTAGTERLSDVEALMWRLGCHDARLRPLITVVVVLESSPGVEAVAERAAALVRAAPRFASRVAPPVSAVGPPRLVPDEQLDLSHHVRLAAVAGDGSLEAVLAQVGPLCADDLDPARPLWQMTLVEGMAGGRAALVVRLHHCLTDGMGLLALAEVLFAEPSVLSGLHPGPGQGGGPLGHGGVGAALSDLVDDVRSEAAAGARLARAAVPVAAGLLRRAASGRRPDAAAAGIAAMARSVGAGLTGGGPRSPLMTGRSASVALGVIEMDLGAVRRAGRASGSTVNDVFVAAVLDGFGRYHAKHGDIPDDLRVAVPVDLRASGGSATGDNHFFPARILAPIAGGDLDARLRTVHDLVAAARREPAVAAMDAVAAVAARVPGSEALAARELLGVDVVTSNVAGSPTPLRLAGAAVTQLIPFGPRSGAACNVTTVSYAGTLHVGVAIDPAAVPDSATLLECLRDAAADATGPVVAG